MFDDAQPRQQLAAELNTYFGEKLCTTTIPRNVRLAEAPSHGKPVLLYDPRSRGAEAFIRLAKELMERQLQPLGKSRRPPARAGSGDMSFHDI